MKYKIPFNKPFIAGSELHYIKQAVAYGKISGDGIFSDKCHKFFEARYKIHKAFLTTSCTDALEMAAILLNIKPGDEVIAPSFTFVSTVNAFVLRGAKIVFADSKVEEPTIDETKIEALISPKTKAIIVVHYAGVACNMEKVIAIAQQHNLFVVEDAAQAIESNFTFSDGSKKSLGSIGELATFSFHETKNINAGEGGMLAINNISFIKRAEIIREKGTSRTAFFRGEIDKYGWEDIGSSFLPSEITAAFLYAQLEQIDTIQAKRKALWLHYFQQLSPIAQAEKIRLPFIPNYAENNAHIFYIICKTNQERTNLISYLRKKEIHTAFHYQSLHKSSFYLKENDLKTLPNCERYSDCLLRLPMYFELSIDEVTYITEEISKFFKIAW